MAKRNSYKRSYDFPKSAASTHVQNKLRDNNRDALVKANLLNAGNRGVAMLAAAGSSDETPGQVMVSAPAPKPRPRQRLSPASNTRRRLVTGETGTRTATSANLDLILSCQPRRRRTSLRRGVRSRATPMLPDAVASVTSVSTCTRSPRPSRLESARTISATPRSSTRLQRRNPRHHHTPPTWEKSASGSLTPGLRTTW